MCAAVTGLLVEDACIDALRTSQSINEGGSGLSMTLSDYGVGFYNNWSTLLLFSRNWF